MCLFYTLQLLEIAWESFERNSIDVAMRWYHCGRMFFVQTATNLGMNVNYTFICSVLDSVHVINYSALINLLDHKSVYIQYTHTHTDILIWWWGVLIIIIIIVIIITTLIIIYCKPIFTFITALLTVWMVHEQVCIAALDCGNKDVAMVS